MNSVSSLLAVGTAILGFIWFTSYEGGKSIPRVRVEGSDGVIYVVNSPDEMEAVALLEEINRRIHVLISHLPKSHILRKRYDPSNLAESPIHTNSSSWSVEKKKIFLCLRDRTTGGFYDADVLFFVVVHELAHLASKSYGHNDEFMKNFANLKNLAASLRLMVIQPNISVPYCGTIIYDKNAPS